MILGSCLNETMINDTNDQSTTCTTVSHVDLRRRRSCPSLDEITFAEENDRICVKQTEWNDCDDDDDSDDMTMYYLEDVHSNYTRSHWASLQEQ